MKLAIYDKTDKGREEIATRRHHLAPRLRTLLVMVDGRRTEDELLKNVAGLGLGQGSVNELLDQEFIVLARGHAPLYAIPVEPAVPKVPVVSAPPPAPPTPAPPDAAPASADAFQDLYNFFNKNIKGTLGLRGFTLQLKVEKAATLAELLKLRQPYLDAVLKAKGADLARAQRAQLVQLTGEQSGAEDLALPDDQA